MYPDKFCATRPKSHLKPNPSQVGKSHPIGRKMPLNENRRKTSGLTCCLRQFRYNRTYFVLTKLFTASSIASILFSTGYYLFPGNYALIPVHNFSPTIGPNIELSTVIQICLLWLFSISVVIIYIFQ
jgi:hypothetical protein